MHCAEGLFPFARIIVPSQGADDFPQSLLTYSPVTKQTLEPAYAHFFQPRQHRCHALTAGRAQPVLLQINPFHRVRGRHGAAVVFAMTQVERVSQLVDRFLEQPFAAQVLVRSKGRNKGCWRKATDHATMGGRPDVTSSRPLRLTGATYCTTSVTVPKLPVKFESPP